MVDVALVLRKLASLDEYRKQVGEYSAITVEEYSNDWKTQRIVERTLQMMIELCADIAGHVISDDALRTPETYADAFRVLGENGILTPGQTSVMEKMAKFRNIVVHQYERVDAEIVILILRRHLDDFQLFSDAVARRLGVKGR
jgi:uncharacterized protein YutE (UPF0331/DUF86 family)